jgi:O-antigen/teichoic acid export membrane protein
MAHYTPSVFFRNIVGLLNTFIRPKLLTPQLFGLWSLLNTIPGYARYLHLGCRDYMRFAIPRLEAHDDEEAARRIELSVFWGSLIPNAGVAAALLILSAVSRFSTEVRIGLAAIAVVTVLTCIYEFYTALMKGRQMFRDLSRGMYLRNASQLVLSIPLMLYIGVYGLFIAVPVSEIIGLIYLRRRCSFTPFGRFSWPAYLEMVQQGWPLTVFTFLMTFTVTSGRLLVAGCLSTEEVGYYALATLALGALLDFPGAAREVLEPRIMEELDTLHSEALLDRYLYRPLVINACYLPLLIAPGYFMISPLIEWILPSYIQGVVPLQIILFGFYFLAVFYPMRGIIVAYRLQKAAVLLAGGSVLVNVALSLAALQAGFGITGVAVANSVSYAVLLILMAGLLKIRQGIRFPFEKVWPVPAAFLLLCAAVWISRILIQPLTGSGFAGAVIQSALILGTGFVLVTLAEYKMPLLQGASPLSILRLMLRKRPNSNSTTPDAV